MWDNYVFELLSPLLSSHSPSDQGGGQVQSRPIGFLNLSDALVETIEWQSSSAAPSSVLCIALRYFPSAAPTAIRRRVVVRHSSSSRSATLKLSQQLQAASKVSERVMMVYALHLPLRVYLFVSESLCLPTVLTISLQCTTIQRLSAPPSPSALCKTCTSTIPAMRRSLT